MRSSKGDISCALSPAERAALLGWAQGRRVVEAGSLLGGSTVDLAQVAMPRMVSIDRHEGYGPSTLRRFLSNLDRFGVSHLINIRVGDAKEIVPTLSGDLLFVDLTCEEELTRSVVEGWKGPLVAIHDTHRSRCAGVERVIEGLGLKALGQWDTLFVGEKK